MILHIPVKQNFHPIFLEKNNELRAQDKVIHICKKLGGTKYINAIGGQELYSGADFAKQGENFGS